MPKRKRETPFGYEPYPALALRQMQNIVNALNGPTIRTSVVNSSEPKRRISVSKLVSEQKLQDLVQAWMESGPDLLKLFVEKPELKRLVRHGETLFYPVQGGRGHLDWIPTVSEELSSKYDARALEDFMILITNPLWELLGGPCARCNNYYLKKTRRQKIYCSRSCGGKQTAYEAVKRRRKEEHSKKLRLAAEAIREWGEKKRRMPWKKWISIQTGLTDRWITRAVNRGELSTPQAVRTLWQLSA